MSEGRSTGLPTRDDTPFGKARDRAAWAVASFALKHIATPWYAAMIEGSIRLGLRAAEQEARDV